MRVASAGRRLARRARTHVAGRDVDFTLVRVAGRRHVHVIVEDDGDIVVRAPWRCGLSAAEEAIRDHEEWVVRTMDAQRARVRARPRLVTGTELPLLDERLRLEVRVAAQLALLPSPEEGRYRAAACGSSPAPKEGWVRRRGARLEVCADTLRTGAVRALLERWYRGEARGRLPRRLETWAGALGVRPRRISVRAQRTRWGSCSSTGTVSLNWRLVLLPSELADYVLVHELCHLRHMDHSPRFWGLVESVLPDWTQRRDRLDAAQSALPL